MEAVAIRAETSKRTLYAHFENKEKLYLAVIGLVRELFLRRLRTPGEHSEDTAEAVTLFCGQFLEVLLYDATIRMCRVSMAEADRFPEGAAQYFDVLFSAPHERLAAYLTERFGLPEAACSEAASELLGRLIFPRFPRALFGMEPLFEHLAEETTPADLDLKLDMKPVRSAVAELMESLASLSANSDTVSAKTSLNAERQEHSEISEAAWERILPLLPAQRPQTGRPALNHRQVVNGILWVRAMEKPWRDLPARYGNWRTIYSRFRRWQAAGVWQTVMAELPRFPDDLQLLDILPPVTSTNAPVIKLASSEARKT